MDSTEGTKAQQAEKPKAQLYSLKTPYMKQGRITPLVAQTPNMRIHVKINAEGGENVIHAHLNEDHSFIVLEGEMTIFDENGNEMVVKPYQGVLLPKGTYYRYLATGTGNLVVLRVAASVPNKPEAGEAMRVSPNCVEILPGGPQNKNLPPIQMPGKFFAELAGLD
jgi:mannose-6-phosphate isomerase-like protein (cupin superfamily)